MEIPARKLRFQHVCSIDRSLRGSGPDDGMKLIDEKDHGACRFVNLIEHSLQPVLEFAPVFCPGKHRAEIKRKYPLVFQCFGNVTAHDPLRQPLNNSGLTYTRIANDDGVIFRPSESTCITRLISSSRPITGSSFPLRASSVRSRVYFCNA